MQLNSRKHSTQQQVLDVVNLVQFLMEEYCFKWLVDGLCELVGLDQFDDEIVVEGGNAGQSQTFPSILLHHLVAPKLLKNHATSIAE